MTQQVCPFLGTLDSNNRRAPHVEFPSFENHCLAGGMPELILLGDQATYCLSAACTNCPRYRAGRQDQALGAGFVPFVNMAEDTWSAQAAPVPDLALLGSALDEDAGDGGRARWGKLGAALIFATVLLCGSLTAAYSGWQWVTRDLRPQTAAGRVDVTGNTALDPEPTPAVYVVMTATPQQVVIAAPQQPPAVVTDTGQSGIIPVLPQAVTPTPIRIDPGTTGTGSSAGAETTGTGTTAAGPATGDPTEGTPLVDVELLVPTRRPTPVFDVPTSTPLPDGSTPGDAAALAATNTPVPTPAPLGTPIVLFAPKDSELMKGDCTMVQWNVQNVREVYYENLPENGQGEREECMRKAEDQIYTLLVVWGDGSPHTYTTTVAYLPPTPTVTVTPSFTPEPVFTPTWTPEPPTPTPPPNMFYATNLSVNGSADIQCAAGQTCDVGLLITNGGSGTDNVTVMVLSSDGFPVQLCRPDGVCGSGGIPINNIGASNTAYVNARFTVPTDATSQARGTASFQARSDGSGGGITSGVVNVSVTVP